MTVGGYSLNGIKHSKNQDNFLIKTTDDLGVYVVADGMGGHAAGDVASTLAIEIIDEKLVGFDEKSISSVVSEANIAIIEKAASDEKYKGMGTTLAMCVVKGNELYITHIGDSRIYIEKTDGDVFVTKDHSVVQQMVDRGEITDVEAKAHKMKNVITRALGVEDKAEIETEFTDLTAETVIVICSDGVSNVLDDAEVIAIAKSDEAEIAAKLLCETAKEKGSTDDITAIVINNRGDAE